MDKRRLIEMELPFAGSVVEKGRIKTFWVATIDGKTQEVVVEFPEKDYYEIKRPFASPDIVIEELLKNSKAKLSVVVNE